MHRRQFMGGALAAAPATFVKLNISDRKETQVSSSVAGFAMAEAAGTIVDIGRRGVVTSDHARRTSSTVRLLDRHFEEIGILKDVETKIMNGSRPGLDTDAVADVWERYGLRADRASLRRKFSVTDRDYERASKEISHGGLTELHAKLLLELDQKAEAIEGFSNSRQNIKFLRVDQIDCFCRTLRVEAAILGLMGFFGCLPCTTVSGALVAIEALLEYALGVCEPKNCDTWMPN